MTPIRQTRRHFLAGAASLVASSPSRCAEYCHDQDGRADKVFEIKTPLGDVDRRVRWGMAIEAPALYDADLIEALTRESPRFLAIASGLKFGNVHPQRPDVSDADLDGNWSQCDDVVALASRLRIPIRGDCLVWNDWLPEWVKHLAAVRPPGWQAALDSAFEHHIAGVFGHFDRLEQTSGKSILQWCGAVNEPFNPWSTNGDVAAWRTGAWLDAFGFARDGVPNYIHKAFDLCARYRHSKGAALFLNEAHCDNDRFGPLVRPAMLRLVDALQRSGHDLGAVGLECHLMPQWMQDRARPDWTNLVAFIKDIARRGIEVFITELDVNDCAIQNDFERDAIVARYTSTLVESCLSVPAVTMVSGWDFSDKYSWLRGDGRPDAVYPSLGHWAFCTDHPYCPRPDLYDQEMRPKQARQMLARALASHAR